MATEPENQNTDQEQNTPEVKETPNGQGNDVTKKPLETPATPEPENTVDPEPEVIKADVVEKSATVDFIVDAIEGNGAHEKENEGCTLRLIPVENDVTKAFFKHLPPVLHIGVVHPEVAAKFKVGARISVVLMNED